MRGEKNENLEVGGKGLFPGEGGGVERARGERRDETRVSEREERMKGGKRREEEGRSREWRGKGKGTTRIGNWQ